MSFLVWTDTMPMTAWRASAYDVFYLLLYPLSRDLVAQKHCTGCGVLLIGGREQDMLSADISMPPASCQSDGIFHKLSCPWCKAVVIKKLFVHKIHPLKCLRQSFVLATFLTVLRLVILAFLSLLYSYAQDKFSLQIFL